MNTKRLKHIAKVQEQLAELQEMEDEDWGGEDELLAPTQETIGLATSVETLVRAVCYENHGEEIWPTDFVPGPCGQVAVEYSRTLPDDNRKDFYIQVREDQDPKIIVLRALKNTKKREILEINTYKMNSLEGFEPHIKWFMEP